MAEIILSSSQIQFSTAQRASLAPAVLWLGLAVTVSTSGLPDASNPIHDVSLAAASEDELSAVCALLHPSGAVEGQFQALFARWRAETNYMSNLDTMILHWAYQRIIGFGPQVIPSILAQLQR